MSYAVAVALQRGVYEVLQADGALTALVGDAIYDHLPGGEVPEHYVSIGAEDVRDRSDQTGALAEHRLIVSAVSAGEGFETAKAIAGAVTDALVDANPVLTRGRIVAFRFMRARARRVRGREARRIDLTFRAIVEDS